MSIKDFKPSFSVVIPMYNSEKTIVNTLESVVNQTYSPVEIIIVNDGSKDQSKILVENFISNTNTTINIILINRLNSGVSVSRNMGIKTAKGEYIALLDADDRWHPQKLELIHPFLNKKYSFVGHKSTLENVETEKYIVKSSDIKTYNFWQILLKNQFVTPSVVFKNNGNTFFDESMKYTEDHDLWLKLTHKQEALFINLPLVTLGRPVMSKGGASESKWKMRKGEIKMYLNATRYSFWCKILFPLLVVFSMLKHIKGLLNTTK